MRLYRGVADFARKSYGVQGRLAALAETARCLDTLSQDPKLAQELATYSVLKQNLLWAPTKEEVVKSVSAARNADGSCDLYCSIHIETMNRAMKVFRQLSSQVPGGKSFWVNRSCGEPPSGAVKRRTQSLSMTYVGDGYKFQEGFASAEYHAFASADGFNPVAVMCEEFAGETGGAVVKGPEAYPRGVLNMYNGIHRGRSLESSFRFERFPEVDAIEIAEIVDRILAETQSS